jgi:hypothetical protein
MSAQSKMSAQRAISWIAGLSLGPLLFVAGGLHGLRAAAIRPAAATTLPAGRITGEPVGGPLGAGTPPSPSPLAPPPQPAAESPAPAATHDPGAGTSAADLPVRAAVAAEVIAGPPPPRPPRSSDVVDDSRPITESVFDKEDLTDHHPVNDHHPVEDDGPITGSVFDNEDLVDHHPVP